LTAPVIGDAVAVAGLDVAVEALVGGVQPPVLEPLVEGRVGIVQPLGRLGVPVEQFLRAGGPPTHRVGGRLLVERRIGPAPAPLDPPRRRELLALQHPVELTLQARVAHLSPSGIPGSTVLPKVELITAANDAYQAATAVSRPNQPPISTIPLD